MTSAVATVANLSGTYVLDPTHTRVGFVARHAMVTKVRGQFNEFEGTAVVDGTDLTRSTVQLTIQAASIDTRNEQRDGHLRSNDFLAMEEYPQITFVSTAVETTGPTSVEVTGDLTIKGVTNSVTIPFEFEGAATDPFGNQRVGFEGSVVINRKDYGVTWNAALETGGVLVSETITLEFEVSALKAAWPRHSSDGRHDARGGSRRARARREPAGS
jgi:polyisoprenoid-binding protein YceI